MELPQRPGRGPERVQGAGSLAYSDAAVLRHGQAPGEARQVPQRATRAGLERQVVFGGGISSCDSSQRHILARLNETVYKQGRAPTVLIHAFVLKNGYMIYGFESRMYRMG